MPKSSFTAPGDRPQPAPVGLLLPATRSPRTPRSGVPDWHGLAPSHLAYLIRRYTHDGDVVLDLDASPAAIAATAYLDRVPARLFNDRHGLHVRLLPPTPERRTHHTARRPGPRAGLILAALPQGAQRLARDGLAAALSTWRPLLRPGGYLLVGLTASQAQPGEVSHRATVIAAARTAGFFYHQHIPAVLVPLPEHEPRTSPERPDEGDDGRRLLAGRHLPTFRDLLAFGTTATGEENARD
ncbi:hypothetical protein [Micromonospora tulbaghiae]|uniref:hypothetical protein n=1 Tax=Micromonospora tulbaghiae TaxID=479978 RepID=UPI0033C2EBC8